MYGKRVKLIGAFLIVFGLLVLVGLILQIRLAKNVSFRIIEPKVLERIDVEPVFAGFPVGIVGGPAGFSLYTQGKWQFVAYYDANRNMRVAARRLDEQGWEYVTLPEKIDWDSHKYVTLTVDKAGYIHLAGNMHDDQLRYYRTAKPFDITTFRRIRAMVGQNEDRCTYPRFIHGPHGELIFTYRYGKSGAGDQIFNVYDLKTKTWRRLLDKPLFSGEGRRSVYFRGPKLGPDGYFHLCWVWRDTGDCATNHSLSYARSRDLVHWETSWGKPLELPITYSEAEIVDPVPVREGLINNNTYIGFDTQGRVIISYQKYDEKGMTQIYQARLENSGWKIYQTTDWNHRWELSGGGSIVFELRFGPVTMDDYGQLIQWYKHVKYGTGTFILDEATLRPIGQVKGRVEYPGYLELPESRFPGMQVNWAEDDGLEVNKGIRFVLRWETLPENRDQPREGPLPAPTMLRVYKLTNGAIQAIEKSKISKKEEDPRCFGFRLPF